jgi:hypothetical protein
MARLMVPALWICFAVLLLATGYVVLIACELGLSPLFGYRLCSLQAQPTSMTAEQDRQRALLDRIHETELRIAGLPGCAPNLPPRAEFVPTPSPLPDPPSNPPDPPSERAEPRQELTIPARLDDLKGCWQSVKGDIDIVTDDEQKRPVGKTRICLCFANNGRGKIRWIYTDGYVCEGNLRALLKNDELAIQHDRIPCVKGGISFIVPEKISCKANPGEVASCDTEGLGRRRTQSKGEQYKRVGGEYCGWRGSN